MKRLSILFISLLFSIFAMSQPFSTIANGESGLSVRTNLNNLINYVNDLGWKVQFSSDKEGWHDSYVVGDYYIRFSTDYGDTYTNPVLIFDGQTVIDSLDMNNNGIINMQPGINVNDAVTLGQMMDSLSLAGGYDSIRYNDGFLRAYSAGSIRDSTRIYTGNLYFFADEGLQGAPPTLKHTIDHTMPMFISEGADVTDLGDGTVGITYGEAILKTANEDHADLKWVKVPADTLTITPEENIILYIDYNNGSPVYAARQSTPGYFYMNWDKLPFATVVNRNDKIIINDIKSAATNSVYKNTLSQLNYEPIRYLGGLIAAETDTRKITVSAGAILRGNKYEGVATINTNTGSTFTRMYYTTGSGWTRTDGQTTVSNSQYNDISTGLATLTSSPERWANKWLFYVMDNPNYWILIEGQTAFTSLAAAEAGGLPAILPPEVSPFYAGALLVAKIIVSGNETNIIKIQNPFTTVFQTAAASSHNNLSDLQLANNAVTYGHISDQSQTLYGEKSFMTSPLIPPPDPGDSTLRAANTLFVLREIANNTFLYTDEEAQDAVGGILDNGTIGDIIFTYDDGTPKISGIVKDDSHDHVISNVDGLQDALNAKQATITGAASTVVSSNLSGNMALISNSSGKIAASATVSSTELGYLDGVTSGVQDQIDALPTFLDIPAYITDLDSTGFEIDTSQVDGLLQFVINNAPSGGDPGESLWTNLNDTAIYYANNVGIGTNQPSSKLSVFDNDANNGVATFYNSGNGVGIVSGSGSAKYPLMIFNTTSDLLFSINGDGKMNLPKYAGGTFDGTASKYLTINSVGEVVTVNPPAAGSSIWTDAGTYAHLNGYEDIYMPYTKSLSFRNSSANVTGNNVFSIGATSTQLTFKGGVNSWELATMNIGADAYTGYIGLKGRLISDYGGSSAVETDATQIGIFSANGFTKNAFTGGGALLFSENDTHATPGSGYGSLKVKTDGKIYFKNDGGTEYDLTEVGSGGDMVYPGAGIPLSTGSSWGTSITNNSANWNTAYNDKINSASFNSGTLTLTQQDAGTVTVSLDGRYLTGNQTITLSGDLSGSGTTSIDATIASGAVEAGMLNNNIISGKSALTSGLASTDELLVSDAGTVKRMDVSVLQDYMQSNLSFDSGGSMVYPAAGIAVSSGTGWGTSITNNSANWNTAYSDKINSAAFNTSTGVVTLTQQDAGTVTVDIDGRFPTVPGSLSATYPIPYFNNSPTTLAESNLTVNATHGGLTNSINQTSVYSANIINTSSSGLGLFVRGGGSSSNIMQLNDYANTPRFAFRGDGAMFAPNLGKGTTDSIVYWDHTNGELLRGVAPSGGSSLWTEDTNGITYTVSGKNVGIGTASSSLYKLNIQGDTYSSGSMILNGAFYGMNGVQTNYIATTSMSFTATGANPEYGDAGDLYLKNDSSLYYSRPSGIEFDLTGIKQRVLNGSKNASFTHNAELASIGAYTLSTSNAVTVSIHNLASGMQGTIYLAITTNPSSITVNTYSDAGSTGLTEVVLGNAIDNTASKSTSITYTCVNNGTNTLVYLIYEQQQ